MKESDIRQNKVNQQALNKTLKLIEKKIVKVLKYYINDADKQEIKSIMDYLMSDIKDIVTENMKTSQKIVRRKFSQRIENAIIKSFQDVDIIKQVLYENNSTPTFMRMIVIYDHDDEEYAINTVCGIIERDLDFDNLIIEPTLYDVSEFNLDPGFFKGTTTLFKR